MRKLILISFLLFVTFSSYALLPPKYLAVKHFKQCLATKDMGSWQAWCMPVTKPKACPTSSWKQLNDLTGQDRIPNC